MRSFLITMVLTSLTIAGTTVVLSARNVIPDPSFKWVTLVVLFGATALIFRRVYASGPVNFVSVYLLTMVVKILVYLAYIIAVILMDRVGAEANVVFFLVLYLIYTGVEIGYLYPRINR